MSTDRYSQIDTQIIETSVDPFKSREFLDLSGVDEIAKIPVAGGVAVFYKNATNHLVYGKFTLQEDETYTGTVTAISQDVTFTTDEIFIFSGYYDQNETFYVFYNKDDNIYLRSFHTKQVFLGTEILVKEDASISKIKRINEMFFMIFTDTTNSAIYEQISTLGSGELRLLSVYENDITKHEGKYDETLNVQICDNPFNDIGEKHYTCQNEEDNKLGFLHFTSTPSQRRS